MVSLIPFPQKIAFILPRYAESIGGGAETLSRELAHALCRQQESRGQPRTEVEVWTTCALDHRSWKNELPPGMVHDGPIRVHRFPVDERDLEVFITSEHSIQRGETFPVARQLAWMEASVNSKALYAHILAHGQKMDVLVFAPYLFATTFWGSLIYPERSVVIPCLHDEPYAYLDIFQYQLSKVRGVLCNAEPERALLEHVYEAARESQKGNSKEQQSPALYPPPSKVVGMGFGFTDMKIQEAATPVPTRSASKSKVFECNGIQLPRPYLLYSGRKEVGKNVDFLLRCFEEIPAGTCSLVLIGSGSIDFRTELPEGVFDLGFVSEEEKLLLMRNALALCQPSLNESFSIVMMEAWQQGCPCVVHGAGAVTRYHVTSANGGLYFENAQELAAVTSYLIRNPDMAAQLGANGARYVAEEYSWDAVLDRFSSALVEFGLLTEENSCELATAPEKGDLDKRESGLRE